MAIGFDFRPKLLLLVLALVAFSEAAAGEHKVCLANYLKALEERRASSNAEPIRVTVLPERASAANQSNGAQFGIRLVVVESSSGTSFLHEKRPAGANHPNITITLTDDHGVAHPVALPEPISQRILDYLVSGTPNEPFDCNCFAHYVNGMDFKFSVFKPTDWIVTPFPGERVLKPGDSISIGHSWNELTHLAVYLGSGLYLSKFGSSGPLIVTGLDEMKRGFGGGLVWLLRKPQSP